MKKIGIFGGSFNPPHIGHVEIVRQILAQKLVDRIIVVPAFQNPLKSGPPQLSGATRLEVLKECFADFEEVECSAVEIQQPKPSYTYLTLEHFAKSLPGAEFYLIMGADSFGLFSKWKKTERILQLSTLMVFHRKGQGPFNPKMDPAIPVQFVELDLPNLSSTQIREMPLEEVEQKNLLPAPSLKVWRAYKKLNL